MHNKLLKLMHASQLVTFTKKKKKKKKIGRVKRMDVPVNIKIQLKATREFVNN